MEILSKTYALSLQQISSYLQARHAFLSTNTKVVGIGDSTGTIARFYAYLKLD
jgi:hypothetical protein